MEGNEILFNKNNTGDNLIYVNYPYYNTNGGGITIYNFSNNKFIIDSSKYNIIGENIQNVIFRYNHKEVALHFELDTSHGFIIYTPTKAIKPEISKCPITIWGHYKTTGIEEIYNNTIIIRNKLVNDLFIEQGAGKYMPKIGQKFKLGKIRTNNFTDEDWNLVKFSYDTDEPQNITEYLDTLPQIIPSYERPDYGYIEYTVTDTGYHYVYVYLDYESQSGKKLQHNRTYYFDVQPTTDVNDLNDVRPLISIFPNPATSQIVISGLGFGAGNIEIYNVMGEIVCRDVMLASQYKSVDVSSLPPGIYYLSLRAVGERVTKQFAIIR